MSREGSWYIVHSVSTSVWLIVNLTTRTPRLGPLNIPELALYPTACQLTTTSMAQMASLSTSTILRAFYNSQLGASESKDLLGLRQSSRETFLGPGDAERVRFPTQRYVQLGRHFRKVFGLKIYHTHLLRPLLRTAVRTLWGAYQCYNT